MRCQDHLYKFGTTRRERPGVRRRGHPIQTPRSTKSGVSFKKSELLCG